MTTKLNSEREKHAQFEHETEPAEREKQHAQPEGRKVETELSHTPYARPPPPMRMGRICLSAPVLTNRKKRVAPTPSQ